MYSSEFGAVLILAYCISLKSRHGEILFQGPVWYSDNSRVVSTDINTHVHTQLR